MVSDLNVFRTTGPRSLQEYDQEKLKEKSSDDDQTVIIIMPFKDQELANVVGRQLTDLSNKL